MKEKHTSKHNIRNEQVRTYANLASKRRMRTPNQNGTPFRALRLRGKQENNDLSGVRIKE